MASIRPLLDALVPEVQAEAKQALGGLLTGAIVRGYLPQAWVFETEEETVTFLVDRDGNARTLEGPPEHPDVGIRGPSEDLAAVLRDRQMPEGAGQHIMYKHFTRKGELAWRFLKNRFGF
ncbi:MAG: hypothetical protein GWN18_17815 [Thermoplasmata archaeon]|nr:hypothetical protein [Thermoplasmata archaeon]NIS13982.1 hypothetical protein [Thermoplasmata archaeon]NIU50852.1 hypothetical protein [Thermoplasmata archaeon]NIW84375.1 hypothetical protein [Thermoplasmata archaeon]